MSSQLVMLFGHVISEVTSFNLSNTSIYNNIKTLHLPNHLPSHLPNIKSYNVKKKQNYGLDLTKTTLSDMKKNNIIISTDCLNDSQVQLILKICEEDTIFINELTNKFNYCS